MRCVFSQEEEVHCAFPSLHLKHVRRVFQFKINSLVSLFFFGFFSSSVHPHPDSLLRCIMEKPKVIGPDGLSPISLQRQADVRITTEVIYDVITNCKMISLEESVHAPVAVRNKARADRIAGVQTVSSCLNSRRFAQLEVNEPPKVHTASKEIEKAMKAEKACHALPQSRFRPLYCMLYSSLLDALPSSDLAFVSCPWIPSTPVTLENDAHFSSLLVFSH